MRPGDPQPTALSDALDAASPETVRTPPALEAPSEAAALADALELPFEIARRTGIVFVHGIGTQTPAETFLDWAGPIVDLLTDWRTAQADGGDGDAGGHPDVAEGTAGDRIDDPVWRSEFSFSAGTPPYLEVAVPAHAGLPETTWVMTEAWWASDVRAPSLGRTIGYLRRRMATVVGGIATGYRERADRLRSVAVAAELFPDGREPLDWRLIERLERIQARAFGARPVAWLVAGVGVVALAGYDLLGRIPIGAVRDFAARRMVDSFLVDWFGDLPVLIDDPVQCANVRARLARSIDGLRHDGCDAIVIVAHSGGALVSFETLLDPAYRHLPVDKLVTLGQGLGLAWRLAVDPTVKEIGPGHRLVGNLARARPGLRWVDVWSSFDPAPAGPLPARGGLLPKEALDARAASGAAGVPGGSATGVGAAATVVATGDPDAEPWLLRADVGAIDLDPDAATPRIVVESRPVTNEMNVLTDHGGYWANPEGFLVPLMRHLDAARGPASASRFFRDPADRARRILWRRQRVGVLAAWGWLCSVTGLVTVGGLALAQAGGDERLTRAGHALATVVGSLPGHEVVTGPLDIVGGAAGGLLRAVGLDGLAAGAATLGPPMLGLLLFLVLLFALVKIGAGRWYAWDRRERPAMHPETPRLPERSGATAEAVLLVGGLAGLVLASFGLGAAAGVAIAVAAVAGLLVRLARRVVRMRGVAAAPGAITRG